MKSRPLRRGIAYQNVGRADPVNNSKKFAPSQIFVQIFLGDIVFRHFPGVHFFLISIFRLFNPGYDTRLEGVSFFQ